MSNAFSLDPRIVSYFDAKVSADEPHSDIGGFKVAELSAYLPFSEIHPAHIDHYHTYQHLGQTQDNPSGQITVFLGKLAPSQKNPGRRYIIIVDHATGKRLRVQLPE